MAARCERVVAACTGLVSLMASDLPQMHEVAEAIASRHHGKAPDHIEWSKPELQTAERTEDLARGGN
jgi:hypothetical protein